MASYLSSALVTWQSSCLLLLCINNILPISTAQSPPIIRKKTATDFIMDGQNSTENDVIVPNLQDIFTPFGLELKGIYKRSFAYKTIHERLPAILNRIVDSLTNEEAEIVKKYGPSSAEELIQIRKDIIDLRNEMLANKPLTPLVGASDENSIISNKTKIWNDYLVERTNIEGTTPTWYNTTWIYCECYMYQRLAKVFEARKALQSYDPFSAQKREAFDGSIASVTAVTSHTLGLINRTEETPLAEVKRDFFKLIRLGLWGNRCDLSLSAGVAVGQLGNPLDLLESLEQDILVNDSEYVWNSLTKAARRTSNDSVTVDIVLDNAGYELFTDLCMAAFLVANNLAQKIRFYVKLVPWYISDVTTEDFHWMIERLSLSSDEKLSQFGSKLKDHLESGVWTIEAEPFWTNPYVYSEMAERDPVLYAKLSEASFIIFKGDLNYRKLVGDINWEYTTTFRQAVRGFSPSNFVSLRTVKSDVCVGLKPNQGESLHKKDPQWLFTGQYGLIQGTIDLCPCST